MLFQASIDRHSLLGEVLEDLGLRDAGGEERILIKRIGTHAEYDRWKL